MNFNLLFILKKINRPVLPIKVDPFDRNLVDPNLLPQNAWVIEYEKI
jgi:hypothetical protein